MTAPEPTSNYWAYRQAVQRAIQQTPDQWTFKSDPGYREVLEHVTEEQGIAFREWVEDAMPGMNWVHVIRLAERNDSVGAPVRPLTFNDRLGSFSPSNWRYLCHAVKVWQHIDSLGVDEVDVIELGGGYGGLALYVRGLARMFPTRIRDYTMVDLPEVAILQRQVACAAGVDLHTVNGQDASELALVSCGAAPKVLVSAYAFSEFDQDTRDWYAERLVRYCDHGLMIWNFPEPILGTDGRWYGGPVYPFTSQPLTVTPDEPSLYPGHQMVCW